EDGIRDRNVTGVQTCALPICKSEEHLIKDCPKKRAMKCFVCAEIGHIAKFCKNAKSENKESVKAYVVDSIGAADKWTFEAAIDGKKVDLLLDTGTGKGLLPKDAFPVKEAESKRFGGADKSTSFEAFGPVRKTMTVDGVELEFDTFIGNPRIPLVGREFVEQYKVWWGNEGLFGQKDGKQFTLKKYKPTSCLTMEVSGDIDQDSLFFVTAKDLDEEASRE